MKNHEEPVVEVIEQIVGVIFTPCKQHSDDRGWLIELFRDDEIPAENRPKMAYISQTLPGVARGPHEHTHQSDLFAFLGPGDFRLYMWDTRKQSPTVGNRIITTVGETNPQQVIVPPGVVHAYRNVSATPGIVFNAPNRLYAGQGRRDPVDEIRHEDQEGSPFTLT